MNKTVIICCAGKGTRLGMELPKCLVEVNGKMIIERQLEQLTNIDEIIVVVGYKSDLVKEKVLKINPNIKFVHNDNYENTATGASFILGAKHAKNDFLIALDGDMLVHPLDMKRVLNTNEEFICGEEIHTSEPVFINLNDNNQVVNFSRDEGSMEWSGIAGIYKDNVKDNKWYLYNIMEEILPTKIVKIRAREIDTLEDLKEAERWTINNYDDDKITNNYFMGRFPKNEMINATEEEKRDLRYITSRHSLNNRDKVDLKFIKQYLKENNIVLDLGCGTGILEEKLAPYVQQIIAVDKYQEFLNKAYQADNVQYIASDIIEFDIDQTFDIILLYGVIVYLKDDELITLLKKLLKFMNDDTICIIKNKFGLEQDVIINTYSDKLESFYYAIYRKLTKVCDMLDKYNFSYEIHTAYPDEIVEYTDTEEYALVLRKKDKNK